jgi:hypothetical protein
LWKLQQARSLWDYRLSTPRRCHKQYLFPSFWKSQGTNSECQIFSGIVFQTLDLQHITNIEIPQTFDKTESRLRIEHIVLQITFPSNLTYSRWAAAVRSPYRSMSTAFIKNPELSVLPTMVKTCKCWYQRRGQMVVKGVMGGSLRDI